MESRIAEPVVEYITEADGRRTGVILGWEDYQTLRAYLPADPDMLMNMSEPELQALAEGILSSPYQQRLSELLQRNQTGTLSQAEEAELDRLLAHVDYMNILKARAQYTLKKLAETGQSHR